MQGNLLDDLNQSHLDAEWISFVALRDAVGVALRDTNGTTRKETLRLARRVLPTLFSRENSRLNWNWSSREEREILEKSRMRQQPFEKVLKKEISTLEQELKRLDVSGEARTHRARLDALKRLLQETRHETYFEGRLIEADAALGVPARRDGANFEFVLPGNRGMRIRVAHGSRIEAITGADLIYEHHIPRERKARIAAVQYKIMREQETVPKDERLKSQLSRLHAWYCKDLPCLAAAPDDFLSFRFPQCAAFLRATNAVTERSAGLSKGYYMPVCRVLQVYDHAPLRARSLNGQVVTHRIFEDLFNADLLGSRELGYEELERFYARQETIQAGDTVSMNIQIADLP